MPNLTNDQKRVLQKSNLIEEFIEKQIIFKPSFKVKAVEAYIKRKSSSQIFKKAEIDCSFFDDSFPNTSITRWRDKYIKYGKESLLKKSRHSTKMR